MGEWSHRRALSGTRLQQPPEPALPARAAMTAEPRPPQPCAAQVDRIIAHRVRNGRTLYLTKWQGLGYAEATWEDGERDLADDQVGSAALPCQRGPLGTLNS